MDEMVDVLEGLIGRRVSVATVVPSLDDTHVVSKGNESGVGELNSGVMTVPDLFLGLVNTPILVQPLPSS